MDDKRYNESDIRNLLVNVVNELYPFYEEIRPWVGIYRKEEFLNLENDYISMHINFDNIGKILIKGDQLVAVGGFRCGVGVQSDVATIEQGIRTLVKSYFNIR